MIIVRRVRLPLALRRRVQGGEGVGLAHLGPGLAARAPQLGERVARGGDVGEVGVAHRAASRASSSASSWAASGS